MALYYYININLSRINLKKVSGGKRCILLYIYKKNTSYPWAKRKEERGIYITKYPLEIYYIPIYKKNTTKPPGGK